MQRGKRDISEKIKWELKQVDIQHRWSISSPLGRLVAGNRTTALIPLLASPALVRDTNPAVAVKTGVWPPFRFPFPWSGIDWFGNDFLVLCKVAVLTHSALRDLWGIYSVINKEWRVTGRNTNLVHMSDPWMGQKAAVREGWLHALFLGLCVPWGWPDQEHEVLPAQLQQCLELAAQDQSYIIYSHVLLTHAQKYEEILFFKRIFCLSITCFIQDLRVLYIQSLSAISIALMLMEKLVTNFRRIHPADLTSCALS